jgi:beta-lactamase regulating signal transducer with metallopeptidase domain
MIKDVLSWIFHLYYDGFRQMRTGKKLWLIVALKLLIMFVVFKWLFFPDIMQENFHNDAQRSAYILEQLTQGENNASY